MPTLDNPWFVSELTTVVDPVAEVEPSACVSAAVSAASEVELATETAEVNPAFAVPAASNLNPVSSSLKYCRSRSRSRLRVFFDLGMTLEVGHVYSSPHY